MIACPRRCHDGATARRLRLVAARFRPVDSHRAHCGLHVAAVRGTGTAETFGAGGLADYAGLAGVASEAIAGGLRAVKLR
jgi:hypothetical protein